MWLSGAVFAHHAQGSVPNTARERGESALEDGSVGTVGVQGCGPEFGTQVQVKKLGEVA